MKAVFLALVFLIVVVCAAAGTVAYSIASRGLSTRVEPSRAEEILARSMRRLATPGAVRSRRNPVEASKEVLDEALGHFADHCAACHANDGSGDTAMGRSFYPKAPDMRRAATQSLTDGELFSIIENGIRLTGMPAWGTPSPEDDAETWELVHLIRHLPRITPEELEEMKALNPTTRKELEEEEAARRFLAGEAPAPAAHRH